MVYNLPDSRDEYLKNLNANLYQMIEEALRYPETDPKWKKIISSIRIKLETSGEFPDHGLKDPDYQDALQKTQKWFPKNIEQFYQQASLTPNLTVIQWYKNYLVDCLLLQFSRPGRLCSSQRLTSEGTLIYPQALLETQKWFAKHLHEYNPGRASDPAKASLVGWFNQTLFYKLRYPELPIPPIPPLPDTKRISPEIVHADGSQEAWDIKHLSQDDSYENIQRYDRIAAIRQSVQACDILRTAYVYERPDITCQDLLLLRLPDPDANPPRWVEYSWTELEQKFEIPRSKLINCFNRHLTNSKYRRCLEQCLRQTLGDCDLV